MGKNELSEAGTSMVRDNMANFRRDTRKTRVTGYPGEKACKLYWRNTFLNIIYSLVEFNVNCTLPFFNWFCPHGCSSAVTNISVSFLHCSVCQIQYYIEYEVSLPNKVSSFSHSILWFPILAVSYSHWLCIKSIIQLISVYLTTTTRPTLSERRWIKKYVKIRGGVCLFIKYHWWI